MVAGIIGWLGSSALHGVGARAACLGLTEHLMQKRTALVNRVTWTGFFVNLILTIFKFAAGILGHSGAMVADAVHSFSDLATDIVVIVGCKAAGKPADAEHPYGHGKYETLAAALISSVLLLVGAGVFWNGIINIRNILDGAHIVAPGKIALLAAILSIIAKEWLFRYTHKIGLQINSSAIIANAWHHRSDAISSIGTMLGIGGAVILGEPWHILDPMAAVVVSLIIVRVAIGIFYGSMKELTERALDEEKREEILRIISDF